MSAAFVPAIDVAAALAGNATQRRDVARSIGRACEQSGFFTIVGHAVPEAVVANMYRESRRFFELPDIDKHLLTSDPADPMRRGYSCVASVGTTNDPGSVLELRNGPPAARPDLCETFSVCLAAEWRRPGDSPDPANGRSNLWPADARLRVAWMDYATKLSTLAGELLRLSALALDIDERSFDAKVDREITSLTANHYPPQPVPPQPGQLRKGEHTDWGTMTLVHQDGAPGGLEVLAPDGAWHGVPARPGAFVVNVGDLMARWTDDRWRSTPHRVVNPPRDLAHTGRLSIAYFHQPNFDAVIDRVSAPARTESPTRYAPTTSGEYLLGKVARMHGSEGRLGGPVGSPS